MSTDPLDRVKGFFSEEDPPSDRPRRGRYEIVRELGRGGMAVVYEAFDPDLRRTVAVKVLEGGDRDRLRREASAAARLKHPNIVTVHEVGPDFIAMERVEGKTLAEAMPSLSLRERVAVLEKVARAVAHAHAQGVVHRDLKPGNILLEPGGRPVITDFGLARIAGDEDLTRTGSVVGTPHYMAPEQVRGDTRAQGPAADVWALGVILHEMVSGRRPFEGQTALAVYDSIVREEPGPLPGDLGAVAAAALEKDPVRRTPGAEAFAEDLRRYLEGEPVSARPAGPLERTWRRARRHPVGSLLAAGALAALIFAWAERARGVESLRRQARLALDAALELRRAGSNAGMRKFLPPLEEAYRDAAAREPGLAEVDYLLGRMHRALLDDARALEAQERALSKDPRYAPALYERAVLLSMRRGREIKAALDALQGDPAPADPALRDRIAADAKAFLAAGGGGVEALVARGLLAACEERNAEARDLLDEALRRDPLLEEAREALAAVVWSEIAPGVEGRERSWKKAEEVYTQGLARDQGYLPHWMGRGQLRWSRGSARRHRGLDPTPDYTGAEADFAKAIALDPKSADAWTWRGQARVYQAIYATEKGEDPRAIVAKAEEDFASAIAVDASHARAWLWRGNARFYRGVWLAEHGQDGLPDLEASEADLSEAIRLAKVPENEYRWRGRERAQRAAALGRAGRDPLPVFAAAEDDFARSAALRPPDSWHHLWKSTVASERALHGRSRLEDLAKAEKDLDEALRLNRHFAEAWKHRGFVRWHRAEHLEKAGDRAGAKEAYAAAAADFSEALSINPTLGLQVGDRVERARRKAADLGSP